ncbi:Cytochrome subunit of sulfide dehydrogenase [Pandoraea aquatica]|uniref:Cytochrome subunit of sulfide dehydrogenase n=2 Tax=Pandoraea aquatica TaxID=2508290 RepID=A0A5E4YMD2_9BURK|nr:Cytochrome subunit of sulfide dehydrogenase [Pandoraea aquatica]
MLTGHCPDTRRRHRPLRHKASRTIAAAFVLTASLGFAVSGVASAAEALPASGVRAASPVYVAPSQSSRAEPDWQARDWAMACMSCHNASAPVSAGKATLSVLDGRPAAELMAALQAMRDGKRPATLMPQLLKGYREDELQRIAAYFAAQPKPSASSR